MFISSDPQTLFLGKDHLHLPSIPSTNDYIKQKSKEKQLAEGFTVTTAHQTSGRGQIGNTWESESGKNLLMSTFLLPRALPASHFFYLNMSVCLALTDCLNFFHPGFAIKWPNDILFDTRKVAGVLIENSIAANKLQQSVVGVGLNINQLMFSSEGASRATSLAEIMGKEVEISYVFNRLLKDLEVRYLQMGRSKEELRKEYLGLLYGYRQPVRVNLGAKDTLAQIADVLPDGTLVAKADEEIKRFQFKEISFLF